MKYIAKNSARNNERPVVLIAPLDWGLGHATRCIVLIRYMIKLDFEVIIAGEGVQMTILHEEFPELRQIYLKGYRLKYSRSGLKTLLKIGLQIPKILIAIKSEKRWVARFIRENKVDFIISDNRYGFYHPQVHSVFITHQLQIKSPLGKWSEKILRSLNYHFIRKFSECWIPDHESREKNLAGELSHPARLPKLPVKYLGALSRFYKTDRLPVNELLVVLSGPEPQRTILENILLEELKEYTGNAILLRGLPNEERRLADRNNVRFYNHLPAGQLNDLINGSEIVLSRPGYTTVMDMTTLGKKCIFIPTPGQTEQAYLAKILAENSYCLCFDQDSFSLKRALKSIKATTLRPFSPAPDEDFREAIHSLK